MKTRALFAFAVTIFLGLLSGPALVAATIDWNAASGDWSVGGNWSGSAVPLSGDTARINNGGLASVSSNVSALNVNLGSTGGLDNRLKIDSGFTLTTASTSNLGQSAGQFGTATVNGTWAGTGALYVGAVGTGSLTIASGGTVNSASGVLANNTGGSGTANVQGTWGMTGGLTVGSGASSTGNLTVAAGGKVSSAGLTVGNFGTGSVVISGSMNYTGANLALGNQGSGIGTIDIENGGVLAGANNMNIGSVAGSQGTITIKNGGRFLSTGGSLAVGSSGTGTLTVATGGLMETIGGNIGVNVGAVGEVFVSGTWTSSSSLYIAAKGGGGSTGTGTLTVENGGTVTATVAYLGGGSGGTQGTGNLVVKNNGLFETSTDVQVGTYTNGRLTIESGGTVRSGQGSIGVMANSTGTASVAGLWEMSKTVSPDLSVGHSGDGTLIIENSGTVQNRVGYIGRAAGAAGDVTVKNNALWQNSAQIHVGSSGEGSLLIENGGTVTSVGLSDIGFSSTGTGNATVRGTWTNTGDMNVGRVGHGTLSVGAGGLLNVASGTGTVFLAPSSNAATGVLNIGGAVVGGTPGTAEGAGVLNAAVVNGRVGATVTPLVNFNHTATAYEFENSAGQGIVIQGNTKVDVYAGTTSLTAASTYTAGTRVYAGTLLVNNASGSATGTGAVQVDAGARLGGSGIVSGATTVDGILSPGNSIGTLTINSNVTWNFNNAWVWELGTAGVDKANFGTSDMLTIAGNFVEGTGTNFTFDFANTGGVGWYRLANWTGTSGFDGTEFVATNLGSGLSGAFVKDPNALYLNVIPEPSTWGLVLLSLAGLLVFRGGRIRRACR